MRLHVRSGRQILSWETDPRRWEVHLELNGSNGFFDNVGWLKPVAAHVIRY